VGGRGGAVEGESVETLGVGDAKQAGDPGGGATGGGPNQLGWDGRGCGGRAPRSLTNRNRVGASPVS